jgi:hypothetical protein
LLTTGRHSEDIAIADFTKGLIFAIAINDNTYFVFLDKVIFTEPGLGWTIKMFCKTNEISYMLFLELRRSSMMAAPTIN